MTLALVEESFQFSLDTYAADSDALGAPGEPPVGCQYLGGLQYCIEVVHRFSLAHEDDVGQPVTFR